MEPYNNVPRVAMQVTQGCLVVSIQFKLTDQVLRRIQHDVLECVRKTEVTGVAFDLSSVDVIDAHEFEALRRIIIMIALLGAKTVLVGLRPGVVFALVDLDVDTTGVDTALNLEDAVRVLQASPSSEGEPSRHKQDYADGKQDDSLSDRKGR